MDGKWHIAAPPQVALRLKRMFPSLDGQYGNLTLSNRPDNCRDLEWFIQRYPMIVIPHERLVGGAESHRRRTEMVEQLMADRRNIDPVPLAVPLRRYQELPAEIVNIRGSLLLADDVGTGKTAVIVGSAVKFGKFPVLVVSLTHLPKQIEAEFNRFAPHLRTHVIRTGTPYDVSRHYGRGRQPKTRRMPDVIITSYSKLDRWAETLGELCEGRAVFWDEIQELRHRKNGTEDSKKYAAAAHIRSKVALAMGTSATPFYNYGGEMWNVCEQLSPGELGTWHEFVANWCYSAEDEKKIKIKDPVAFGNYLRESGLMLRRTRKDVGRELPAGEPVSVFQKIDANFEELKRIDTDLAELAVALLKGGPQSFKGEKMQQSGEFDRKLRQQTGIAKAPYVANFAKLLLQSEPSVVLFGWHHAVYDIWAKMLAEFHPVFYTGEQSPAKKEFALRAFKQGQSKVLCVSLRAGAGIDGLQAVSRTCIIGEYDWSPAAMHQNIGRLARDGQENQVLAYYMSCGAGSDPMMEKVLGIKDGQILGVRDGRANIVEAIQNDGGHIRKMAEEYLRERGIKEDVWQRA